MKHEANVLLAALRLAGFGRERQRKLGCDLSAEYRILDAISRYGDGTLAVPDEVATAVIEQLSKYGVTVNYCDLAPYVTITRDDTEDEDA